MWWIERTAFSLLLALPLHAQQALAPGEGLAVSGLGSFGEAQREAPMGSLAKLVWLGSEGREWARRGVRFTCRGSLGGVPCWNREGHGEVDLPRAARESCNLAFLAWARESLARGSAASGPDAAAARLETRFRPFLGPRMPHPFQGLGAAWIGDGDLLRTTPEAFLRWLQDPAQADLLAQCRELLPGEIPGGTWWVKTGTAPVPSEPGATSAWAAGGDGTTLAVLHLPRGRGKAEGLARFKDVLGELTQAKLLSPSSPSSLFKQELNRDEGDVVWLGDPEAQSLLEAPLRSALKSTASFGSWPTAPWRIHLHEEAATFEKATGAPPSRAAAWVGDTLHLRPWIRLKRRDLGALLRHEMAHRRLLAKGLPRWEEEARCLWAEGHVRPPDPRPRPSPELRARWDRALAAGSTRDQAWAYASLRAWLAGKVLPGPPPAKATPREDGWRKEALVDERAVTIRWPENRLPRKLVVNGEPRRWAPGKVHAFRGEVRFGNGPIPFLLGEVTLRGTAQGWSLRWTTTRDTWVAAASVGELSEDSPFEARRALAALLRRWIQGRPKGRHGDGTLCPLTHCAVVRGMPSADTRAAAASAPVLKLPSRACFFTGSTGGRRLSPREVWGEPFDSAPPAEAVEEDRWVRWTRTFTPAQVARLKVMVRPGARRGQLTLHLGPSGPYPVESLRLAAGRTWGWTIWPSNAVTATPLPDGSLRLDGQGWGHNAGLDLALAAHQAAQGLKAEGILRRAFGAECVPGL